MNVIVDAYLDNNLGDDLMIKLLLNHFPHCQFYIYTDNSIIKNTFKNEKNLRFKNSRKKMKDLKTTDAYLTIGGSRFQLSSKKQKLWRIYRINYLRKAKRHKAKMITLGANFGPYSDKLGPMLTKQELRKNDLITVRDKEAENFIRSFKSIDNYYLADDIVYNLDKIYPKRNPDKSGLGITAFRSRQVPDCNYDNYQFLAALADNYIQKTGKQVKLFSFDSESQNDLSAAYHIYNMAKEKELIRIVPYLGEEQSFLFEFESCERMIAIRFHSAVLSDIFEIPFLPIIYSNKMNNFLEDRKFTGSKLELKDLDMNQDINKVVDDIIDGNSLFNNFTGEQHNASLHFEKLANLLN